MNGHPHSFNVTIVIVGSYKCALIERRAWTIVHIVGHLGRCTNKSVHVIDCSRKGTWTGVHVIGSPKRRNLIKLLVIPREALRQCFGRSGDTWETHPMCMHEYNWAMSTLSFIFGSKWLSRTWTKSKEQPKEYLKISCHLPRSKSTTHVSCHTMHNTCALHILHLCTKLLHVLTTLLE